MGFTACIVFHASQNMIASGALISHGLMAFNRTWAIIHPISYRTRHSVRVAVLSCCCLWAVNCLMTGVLDVMDRVLYLPFADLRRAGCIPSIRIRARSSRLGVP
ncbi:hypothetical protein BV898_05462 [Hypsibius exemplaris]|uniref:Uncharacterized protein n=1 Tax=Hypsibius exemplaris TaxID=2072580 RepID=A0A1W0WZQ0_HYPEX|nr:hypothetical protein BV898_05462 [Hypsibius exemplaris]